VECVCDVCMMHRYQNLNGDGNFSSEHILNPNANQGRSVFGVDLDLDGDIDVLSASFGDANILLYENVCGLGFIIRNNSGRCERCPPGTTTISTTESTECTPCALGSVNGVGGGQCKPCNGGWYAFNRTSCELCLAGSFSSNLSTACSDCAMGEWSIRASSTCKVCELGKFSTSNRSSTSCNFCGTGRYQDKPGSVSCAECIAGTFSKNEGSTHATDCILCEEGKTSKKGATICSLTSDGALLVALQLGGVVVVITVLYLLMRKKWKRANNAMLFSAVVSVLDVVTDWLFVASLVDNPEYPVIFLYVAGTSLVCALFANAVLCVFWVLRPELKRPEFSQWLADNTTGFVCAFLLSLSNLDALRVLWSEMFYAKVLSAPVTLATDRKVRIGGLVGTILEDIPQFAVQIAIVLQTGVVTRVLAATMTVTVVKIIFDVIRGCLFAVYSQKHQLEQMRRRKSQPVFHVPLNSWSEKDILKWCATVRMHFLTSLQELQRRTVSEHLTGADLRKTIASNGKLPGGLQVKKVGRDGLSIELVLICDKASSAIELVEKS